MKYWLLLRFESGPDLEGGAVSLVVLVNCTYPECFHNFHSENKKNVIAGLIKE